MTTVKWMNCIFNDNYQCARCRCVLEGVTQLLMGSNYLLICILSASTDTATCPFDLDSQMLHTKSHGIRYITGSAQPKSGRRGRRRGRSRADESRADECAS